MKKFRTADVRLEGEVNRFWTVFYKDGTHASYSAIDSSTILDDNDQLVDIETAEFLEGLEGYADEIAWSSENDGEPNENTVEFSINKERERISNIRVWENGDHEEPEQYDDIML